MWKLQALSLSFPTSYLCIFVLMNWDVIWPGNGGVANSSLAIRQKIIDFLFSNFPLDHYNLQKKFSDVIRNTNSHLANSDFFFSNDNKYSEDNNSLFYYFILFYSSIARKKSCGRYLIFEGDVPNV